MAFEGAKNGSYELFLNTGTEVRGKHIYIFPYANQYGVALQFLWVDLPFPQSAEVPKIINLQYLFIFILSFWLRRYDVFVLFGARLGQ
jgi:hypothetical protein